MEQKWLTWAKEIQAIAQTGLTYAKDVYDIERYQALRELSVDILANYTFESKERIRLSFASEGGYSTPKVDIRGVVFQDDRILLVREKLDGKWALPGAGEISVCHRVKSLLRKFKKNQDLRQKQFACWLF